MDSFLWTPFSSPKLPIPILVFPVLGLVMGYAQQVFLLSHNHLLSVVKRRRSQREKKLVVIQKYKAKTLTTKDGGNAPDCQTAPTRLTSKKGGNAEGLSGTILANPFLLSFQVRVNRDRRGQYARSSGVWLPTHAPRSAPWRRVRRCAR